MTRTRLTLGVVVAVAAAVVVLIAAMAGSGSSTRGRASGSFAWLHPAAAPLGWKVARTPGGSTFAYPPGWRPIKTDPGTASVALLRGGRIEGFLNVTPRQGRETLANWPAFRTGHNRGEGDRSIRVVAAVEDAAFGAGRSSCVIDTYSTSKATYREIACFVSGPRSSAVMVAAAPVELWARQAATLERAVSSFVP